MNILDCYLIQTKLFENHKMNFKTFFCSNNKCLKHQLIGSPACFVRRFSMLSWIRTWTRQHCTRWLSVPCCFPIFEGSLVVQIRMVFGSLLREEFCLLMSCCLFSFCLLVLRSSSAPLIQTQLVSASDHGLQISCLRFF